MYFADICENVIGHSLDEQCTNIHSKCVLLAFPALDIIQY